MEIVLDKSYLEAKPANEIRILCRDHDVLFIESLFFELLTTTEPQRIRCFSKFPLHDNPVLLAPNVGRLLRNEAATRSPAGPPSNYRLTTPFQFNSALASPGFQLNRDQDQALQEWKTRVRADVRSFHGRAIEISTWCPAIRTLAGDALSSECVTLKRAAAQDPQVVIGIYRTLDPPDLPDASLLTPEWATFRYLQANVLFLLDHVARYGFPDPGTPRRIEHDLHDINYALFGTLAGALATCDQALAKNFKLMTPTGILFT